MCVAVVGTIVSIHGMEAVVTVMGAKITVSVDFLEDPSVNDKVLIHAGCAIRKVTKEEFEETEEALRLLEEVEKEEKKEIL